MLIKQCLYTFYINLSLKSVAETNFNCLKTIFISNFETMKKVAETYMKNMLIILHTFR